MIDTSAMVAALVATHEFHELARRHLRVQLRVPAIVLAETYAVLRRGFVQPADVTAALLRPWSSNDQHILATPPAAVRTVFDRAVELNLGGDIHDALVAQTCLAHDVSLVTLDRRQHRVALALGAHSTYLLS